MQELEEKGKLDISSLPSNDQFIDAVAQATTFVLKNSEEDKIRAFQNAIINTALGLSPDKARTQMHLQRVDRFTLWHLHILRLFQNPELYFVSNDLTNLDLLTSNFFSMIKTAFSTE